MLKTYSLQHNKFTDLQDLFEAYTIATNKAIEIIYQSIQWKSKKKKKSKQYRMYPNYQKTKEFKKYIRDTLLVNWSFSNHWIDSAIKTAYGIMESWHKNYINGTRSRNCPVAKRQILRVKQTLMELDSEILRISIRPREFIYIDLSKRYFTLPTHIGKSLDGLGEPILTPQLIHLPVYREDTTEYQSDAIAWDSNMLSLDGFNLEHGWVKVDTRPLQTIHIASFEKRRSIQRKASKSKRARRCSKKYRHRERNRARNHQLKITQAIKPLASVHGVEDLDKERMFNKKHVWNRRVARTDWKAIHKLLNGKKLLPYNSSRNCSRCGCLNKDLKGTVFICPKKNCGLKIDRQVNAAINLYLKMKGVSYKTSYFDSVILPVLYGGYVKMVAERKTTDELVRSLYDVVKPQIYISYDRFADAYLQMPI